jgi:UPF0716 protein FxsA
MDTEGMLPVLFVMLLATPIIELWVIIQVSGWVGFLNTIALLIVISAAGAWLLRQQGLATWARLQKTLAAGQVPTKEVTDGALILFGGALLLTPGFVTDCVGLILLLPPTRALIKGVFRKLLGMWAERRFVPPGGRPIYDTSASDRPRPPRSTRPPPLSQGESREDGFPDKE